MPQGRLFLCIFLVLGICSGCGPKNPNAPTQVTGSVIYKGEKLKAGVITFHNPKGIVTIPLREDGTFSAVDLPDGEVVVTVETESLNPKKAKKTYGGAKGKGSTAYAPTGIAPPSTAMGSEHYVKIPAKYGRAAESPLKVTLGKGKQKKDFELTD